MVLFCECHLAAYGELSGLNKSVTAELCAAQRDSVFARQYYPGTIRVDLGD